MKDWHKCSVDIARNPKLAEACAITGSSDPFLLFVALLGAHTRVGAGGVIPASHVGSATRIRQLASCGWLSESAAEGAMSALEAAGLIQIEDDRSIRLSGYDSSWMASCSRCHTPHPESQFAKCEACRKYDAEYQASRRRRGSSRSRPAVDQQSTACRQHVDSMSTGRRQAVDQHAERRGEGVPERAGAREIGVPLEPPEEDPEAFDATARVLAAAGFAQDVAEGLAVRLYSDGGTMVDAEGLIAHGLRISTRSPLGMVRSWINGGQKKWRPALAESESANRRAANHGARKSDHSSTDPQPISDRLPGPPIYGQTTDNNNNKIIQRL